MSRTLVMCEQKATPAKLMISETPETDRVLVDHMPKDSTEWSEHYLELCVHARKLERERDAARKDLFVLEDLLLKYSLKTDSE